MRFEDWDILLFPRDCKVPVKEFKVACHVIHDAEFSNSHGSFGLPTICCFIPSLASGTPFQISIHSWSAPTVSQFTKCFSKYGDSAYFEARVFIDGQLVASASLERESDWPHVIIHSFGLSKNGDLEPLRFPSFRQELLRQNHWNPADNFGRIKVVISEGFPRDSVTVPIERVKNVVAFSFQHAPLEILEASCIAWPNPSMWRRIPVIASKAVQAYPSDDTESHAHSPRRKQIRANTNLPMPLADFHNMVANGPVQRGHRKSSYQSSSGRSASGSTSTGTLETITDSDAYFDWLNGVGIGMGDVCQFDEQELFLATSHNGRKPANVDMQAHTPGNHGIGPYLDQRFGMQNVRNGGGYGDLAYLKLAAEASNIEAMYGQDLQGLFLPRIPQDNLLSMDLPNSLSHSLLNQPMPVHMLANHLDSTPIPELRPSKEDCIHQTACLSPSSASSASFALKDFDEVGRASQQPHGTRNLRLHTGPYGPRMYRSARPDIDQQMSSISDFTSSLDSGSMGEPAVGNAMAHSIEKGTKRSRDSASTLGEVVKSDDIQKRPSPRARLTALLAHSPALNGP